MEEGIFTKILQIVKLCPIKTHRFWNFSVPSFLFPLNADNQTSLWFVGQNLQLQEQKTLLSLQSWFCRGKTAPSSQLQKLSLKVHICSYHKHRFAAANVTVHEKTKYKSKIAILDNVHWKVQTLCYFMLKSDLPNGDQIKSVWDNAVLFSAFCSSLFMLISSAET